MLLPAGLEHIERIEHLLAEGDLQAAKQSQKKYHQSATQCAAIPYTTGLIQLVSGQHNQAIQSLTQVTHIFKANAKFHNNLGTAQQLTGNIDEAMHCFSQALQLDKNNVVALYNMACIHLEQDNGNVALELLNQLLEKNPNNSQYLCAKADSLRLLRRFKQAVHHYQKCLAVDSNHVSANSNLGVLLVSFGQLELALQHSLKATSLQPSNYLTQFNLGNCLVRLERYDEAMEAFAVAHELEPGSAILSIEIGRMWMLSGDISEAAEWFARAETIEPGLINAQVGIANIMLQKDQSQQAIELLSSQLELHPNSMELKQVYAEALWDEGDVNAALEVMKAINPEHKENPKALARAAQMMASSGEVELAMENYRQALSLNPSCIPALTGMAVKQRGELKHEHAQKMHHLLKSPALSDGAKANLHNGLAYYFDGNRAWEQAADHMAKANLLQWTHSSNRNWDYDKAQHHKFLKHIKKTYTASYFDSIAGDNFSSEEPVFIVAMPRSGTTLTEQILARHPQVLGIGERNFISHSHQTYKRSLKKNTHEVVQLNSININSLNKLRKQYLQQLHYLKERDEKPSATRVVDKMPDNYSQIGWILTLFPKAKIIHCRRDPRSVAFSCWMTQFGKIQWASRWPDLIDRINQYQDMMAHWRNVLPGRFMEIDYEDLVKNQEAVSRKMIAYLELEWDERCLKFYESDRIVRTASITQVRQPIYKGSLAKWEKYQQHIPELDQINIEFE